MFAPVFIWLASFFGAIFTAVISTFLQFLTKRLLLIAAVVAGISSFTIAFFAVVLNIINAIAAQAPESVLIASSYVVPDNLAVLITSSLTVRAARWVYEWNIKVLQMRL
jgi:hypothetical protein